MTAFLSIRSAFQQFIRMAAFAVVAFGLAEAQQTTGDLFYNFDANADQTLDDGWESSINDDARRWTFTSDTRVGVANIATTQNNTELGDLHGISGRLNFPRTNNEATSTRDSAGAEDYNTFASGDATWEFWIRFDTPNLATTDQVIWESGGTGDGSAFVMSNGDLEWVIKDGTVSDLLTVSGATVLDDGEYHHIVGVYDQNDPTAADTTTDTMTIYIDGVQVATTRDNGAPTNLSDWSGTDNASLGGRNGGATGGGVGGDTADSGAISLAAYTNLDGQIAAFRFHDAALTSTQVNANIEAVATETIYFDDGFGTLGTDVLWRNETNWDTNLVSSQNQNVVINANQTAEIDASTAARVQTLYVGNDGASSLASYVTDGTAPADGTGTLNMTGGTLVATQIIIGEGDNVGTFNFTDGTITVAKDADADVSAQQAFHVGFSGTGTTGTSVFNMGTLDQSTSPVLTISGGRFEIGENGTVATNTRINATFNMFSGTFTTSGQNFIIGQGGIADASEVTFNMEGGTVNIGTDLNINDGTARLTQNGGFISARDLQTQNNANSTDIIQLNGGIFEIRDDLNDRGGTSTLNIAGGRLELDAVAPATREVENINFSSGIIEFSIRDVAEGFKALTVGSNDDPNGVGVFTGTGQIEIELDNVATATAVATTTTWSAGSGSGEWTTDNNTEWSAANPIQYITNGTQFDLILPNNASTSMTDLGDLTAVGSDWTLSTFTTHNADDSLRITAANDIGLTPIKAIIDAAGQTITRNSLLIISAEAGGDAAELDMIDGTLDLATSGSDIRVGGEAEANLNISGGIVSANNLIFGGAGGVSGGILNLTGGTLNLDGEIVEGAIGAPNSGIDNAQLRIDGGILNIAGRNITVQRFAVADVSGTTGSFTAVNKAVTSSGTTSIGSAGNGTYTLTDSTHTASEIRVGETTTGVGVVNQNGGSVSVNLDLIVGQNGDGTYTMDRGAFLEDPELIVNRTIFVADGATGVGRFDILAGTVDVNTGFVVADADGSSGTLNFGSTAGVLNPFLSVSGGNLETADAGTGTVNFLSGRVLQETNNLITGQASTSIANVTFGGGNGKFLYEQSGNQDWNTNSGQGNVTVLKNATINVGRDLQLGTDGALDLFINGGAVNVGVNDAAGDVEYRAGSGGDSIRIKDGLFTVSDDFNINDGVGSFQVDGSGNRITVGGDYVQTAGNTLIAALDPLGVTAIDVTGNVNINGTLDIDETNIDTVAPNSASTLGTAGAWDGTSTGWNNGNPSSVGIVTNDRIVVIEYDGALTDGGLALDAGDTTNWTLDTTVANEIAVVAQTDFGTAPVHAILDSDGTTTRSADLTIDATGAAADAAGLTITASDTLDLGGNTLTVQGGATLAGEGTVSNGNTTIASGAFLSSGPTDTGLVGGGSTAGTLTFSGDLTLAAGSTWLVDLVDGSTADFIDVSSNTLTITDANLVFGGFTPAKFTTYSIASYNSLTGTFAGLADGTEINGFEINYGTKAGFANQITLTAVPEPTTVIPMILGALAGGFFWRRKRKREAHLAASS